LNKPDTPINNKTQISLFDFLKKHKSFLRVLFTILFVSFLFSLIDYKSMFVVLKRLPIIPYFSLILAHNLIYFVILSTGYYSLLRSFGSPPNLYKDLLLSLPKLEFLALFVPGRISDLALVTIFGHDISRQAIVATLIIDKIISVSVLLTFGSIGLGMAFHWIYGLSMFLVGVLGVFLLFSFLLGHAGHTVRDWIKSTIVKKFSFDFSGLHAAMKLIVNNHLSLLVNFSTTILRQILIGLTTSLSFYLIGKEVSVFYTIFAISMAQLVALIPISMGGIGVLESMIVLMFGPLKVSSEIIATHGIASRGFHIIVLVFLNAVGFIVSFRKSFLSKTK
jgi:uncharacterized membrane protein YbhN (UPF0104 family)